MAGYVPSILFMLAWFSAGVCGTKTPKKDLDMSTGLREKDWFVASEHLAEFDAYCQQWEGLRSFHLFDFFSHSRRVSCSFEGKGFRARSYDIRSSPSEDILSRAGFYLALHCVLQLCDHALLMAAPPCCLFISISASVHRRTEWRVFGNVTNLKVRMANLIAENALILISLALKWRPKTWVVIEQPKGSRLWNLPKYKSLIKDHSFIFILTYLGFFGMDLLKGCHLCTNMQEVTCLARVASNAAKDTFRARVARKFEKLRRAGKEVKVYYTTGVSKTTGKKTFTGGRDLQSTALYPVRFCNSLFQCWLRAYTKAHENASKQNVVMIDG